MNRLAVVLLLVIPSSAFGESSLLITPTGFGPIRASTTRADLVRLFGVDNVIEGSVWQPDGIGKQCGGTIVYPNDRSRRLECEWCWTDRRQLQDVAIRGDSSRWHTPAGISLGTTLKQLQLLNGRPFLLLGAAYGGGSLTEWTGGLLQSLEVPSPLPGHLGIEPMLDTNPSVVHGKPQKASRSDSREATLLNPQVSYLRVCFQPKTLPTP